MKRPSRSFVVEVRRQRRPPGEPTLSWTEELQKPQSNGAARDPAPPPRPVVETAAATPARPTGRILPSLIEAATPVAAPAADKPPKPAKSAKPAKPRAQRRPHAPAPQPVRVAEPPLAVAAPPPVAEQAAETADQDRSARHRRILARYVFGDASKPGQRWKRRLRGGAS
jgi:hypothetical protein